MLMHDDGNFYRGSCLKPQFIDIVKYVLIFYIIKID